MPYVPFLAPAGLDLDGLRKFDEDQYREIARAWGELVTVNAQTWTAAQAAQIRTNIGSIGTVKIQRFVASGTYTPTVGMLYCVIEAVGGGGAGGGGIANTTTCSGGGGGGGGGYARLVASAATIGASKAVTIGAGGTPGAAGFVSGGNGGDSSVGSLCIAKGGTGGAGGNASSIGTPGAGGTGNTGDFTLPGGSGRVAFFSTGSTSVYASLGDGGNSLFGYGAVSTAIGASFINGNQGSFYGGGGSGGQVNFSATNVAGGPGASGVVVITEFTA